MSPEDKRVATHLPFPCSMADREPGCRLHCETIPILKAVRHPCLMPWGPASSSEPSPCCHLSVCLAMALITLHKVLSLNHLSQCLLNPTFKALCPLTSPTMSLCTWKSLPLTLFPYEGEAHRAGDVHVWRSEDSPGELVLSSVTQV